MFRVLQSSRLSIFAFCAGISFASIGPATDLHIVNGIVSPDGFPRAAVLAEGTVQGPLIVGNKGDNFRINVINQLTDETMRQSTSIHWHGIYQAGTNWADGAAFVTQCPITKNQSFLYDFTVPHQAGTFWYHSHLSTQYCDGLRGPLVIYDPDDPHRHLYDVDDESTVVTLSDWYHAPARSLEPFPVSVATLINGHGRYAGGPLSPLSIINVKSGKRYRIRLVHVGCDPNYVFSVDGHNMTIIEVDGVNHEPLMVDSVQILAGQRYSLILNANQPVDNYWIRANPNLGTTGIAGGLNAAILRYVGAAAVDPSTASTGTALLNEADLRPLWRPGAPGAPIVGGADVAINLALDFNKPAALFTVNGVKFVPPTVPVLLQIMSGAQAPSSLLPFGSIYPLPPNSVIELSIPGGVAGGPHPFHLHGHVFDVVRSAGSSTYNYVNPPRRDVVSVGGTGDNVTIRWVTDNPGPWFLHCHIDWHLEAGLAIIFAENAPAWRSSISPPATWHNLCPTYDAAVAGDQ